MNRKVAASIMTMAIGELSNTRLRNASLSWRAAVRRLTNRLSVMLQTPKPRINSRAARAAYPT